MTQTHRMSARLALALASALALVAPANQAAQAQAPAHAASTAEGLTQLANGWTGADLQGARTAAPSTVATPTATLTKTTTTGDMLSQRWQYQATKLTSGKVLISGGRFSPSGYSAEIFDPATQTYTATGSMVVSRLAHKAVALDDGNALIIGGALTEHSPGSTSGSLEFISSAEIYHADTNTFTSTGSMHFTRKTFTATKLQNGDVLIVGGSDESHATDPVAAAEIYDPDTGTFTLVGSLHHSREGNQAYLLADGTVLITGGDHQQAANSDGSYETEPVTIAEIYDPTTQHFHDVGAMADPRTANGTVTLPNGKVWLIGGIRWMNAPALPSEMFCRNTTELYDPATGTFSAGPELPVGKQYVDAFVMPSGNVVILGAECIQSVPTDPTSVSSVLIYNPTTGAFTVPPFKLANTIRSSVLLDNGNILVTQHDDYGSSFNVNMPSVLIGESTAALSTATTGSIALTKTNTTGTMLSRNVPYASQSTKLASGKVLISGGRYRPSGYSAQIFDPATQTYTATGAMVVTRQSHQAVALDDGNALIVGGALNELEPGNGSLVFVSSAEIYHADTNTFTATGSMQLARQNFTATKLQNGDVLIVGGENAAKMTDAVAAAEIYHPATGTFTLVGSLHHSRAGHTAHLLPDGTVLIMGGDYSGGSTADAPYSHLVSAEVYDPTTQTFHDVGPMGATRQRTSVVNLPDGRAWLIGGVSFSNTSLIPSEIFCRTTTEFYDPATGTFSAGPTLPVGKQDVQAFVMPSGNVVILGGECWGATGSHVLSYNPSTGGFTMPSFTLSNNIWGSVLLESGKILVPMNEEGVVQADVIPPSVLIEENTTSIAGEGAYKSYLPALTR